MAVAVSAWAARNVFGNSASTPDRPPAAPGKMLVITRGKSRCHPATGQPLNDQVIPFVEQLTDPGTSVELWKAAMTTTSEGDTVVVDVDVMHRRPHIERTWRAFTLAWSSSDVRATFDFVGFAAVIWELKSGKQNGAG